MRCAVIEFNAYHEETLPTVVRLLNELDIEPDVYMVGPSRGRDPFTLARELRFHERPAEGINLQGLPFRLRRYGLLIINSIEPATNLQRLAGVGTPVIGVMHNTELLSGEPSYRSFFAKPKRLPLVLGRHIANHFAQGGEALPWISHVYFGRPEPSRAEGPTTFAVSGNVEYARRNYDSLLQAADELAAGATPVRIRIVGRSIYRDGLAFRKEVTSRGLEGAFEFTPREVSHAEFFRLVAGSDFLLPLLDRSDDRLRPYFETKLASSIPFAIGLGVPFVMHRELADAYGVEACGVSYEDGGLTAAMRVAVASSEQDRAGWRAGIEATRSELLAASLANLSEAIATVCAWRPTPARCSGGGIRR